MEKVNVSPERRVRWDEEVLEMPKYVYLERTPKAERARGPFQLLIVLMVLFARF